jgi:small neutral amino acid transporter SnatA (MarC family)
MSDFLFIIGGLLSAGGIIYIIYELSVWLQEVFGLLGVAVSSIIIGIAIMFISVAGKPNGYQHNY